MKTALSDLLLKEETPSGGYYLVELQGLLIAMTSLGLEHGLQGTQASVVVHMGSVVVVPEL